MFALNRLYQPHPKQLASRQTVTSNTDDLQAQLLLRDQLQAMPQQQHKVHVHAAHTAQQYMDPHHGYVQDRSGSSLSAAMSATSGVGLHAHSLMQQQPAKPATLSKAVAGVMVTPKGWQERVEKMTVLSDALNRQVCWSVVSVLQPEPNFVFSALHIPASALYTVTRWLTTRMQHGFVCPYHIVHAIQLNQNGTSELLQELYGNQAGAGNTLLPFGTERHIFRLCCSLRWTQGLRRSQRWRG